MPRSKDSSRPLTDADRKQILKLHADGLSRNAIAKKTGRGAATITRTVHAAGLSFDRRAPLQAAAAKVADAKIRRAAISERLLDKAEQFLADIDKPFTAFNFGGKDNTYNEHTLDRAPTGDIRNLMSSVSIALQRHESLVKLDSDQGTDDAKNMLNNLAEQLGITDA